MTETWKRARKALVDNQDQAALEYYMLLREEDEKNEEANYMAYSSLCSTYIDQNASNRDKNLAFTAVSDQLAVAIPYIAASEGSKEDKLIVIARFAGMYGPLADYAVKTPIATPAERIQMAVAAFYNAGNAIEKAFPDDASALVVAVHLWKEGIKLQRKFYSYSYGGEKAEDYAAKIQKVEPGYEMPKKAGCISFG